MKQKYIIPKIPEDKIIFLDNSSFEIEDYRGIYTKEIHKDINYIKEEHKRLVNLNQTLEKLDNWTTIEEVIKEFKKGNNFFKYLSKKTEPRQTSHRLEMLYRQRRKTLRILEQEREYRNADINLTKTLRKYINKNKKLIEKLFYKNNGHTNRFHTDIKLINTALAFSKQEKVCMFSHDKELLNTFIECCDKINTTRNSYILNDRSGKPKNLSSLIKFLN